MDIHSDPRIRSLPWRDLAAITRLETLYELLLPVPWLAASLMLWHLEWRVPAALCAFVLFLTGLRLVHDAFHENLGMSAFATDMALAVMSVVMLGSMHAVRWNHLRHHRHCLSDEDVEARSARMTGLRAILWGPMFPVLLHAAAIRGANRRYIRWIMLELAANAVWVLLVFCVLDIGVLRAHVALMAVGQCLTAFFAVWTVHHDCDRTYFIARTLRNRFKSRIAFDMFFHVEHHLFPKVPTRRLPELARRLDRVAPELASRQVY